MDIDKIEIDTDEINTSTNSSFGVNCYIWMLGDDNNNVIGMIPACPDYNGILGVQLNHRNDYCFVYISLSAFMKKYYHNIRNKELQKLIVKYVYYKYEEYKHAGLLK